MKSNGRRRWRNWLRKQRQARESPSWEWGLAKCRTGLTRRHRGASWASGDLPDLAKMPISPREFAPHSIVGMTQSARRRAAMREFLAQPQTDGAPLLSHAQIAGRYKIGQRLRACPGCLECFVCVACENETCGKEHHRTTICDGSGTLPASDGTRK